MIKLLTTVIRSVDLNRPVDLESEQPAGEETDGACCYRQYIAHERGKTDCNSPVRMNTSELSSAEYPR
jgi:hypothetical protein